MARATRRSLAFAHSDEGLARLVASDGEAPFAELYKRYHQTLYRYCRSILRDEDDAQDALQSAMAGAFAALSKGERDLAVRPWLFRIAHNESVSLLRRRHPQEVPADELALAAPAGISEPSSVLERRERLATLLSDLRGLTTRQRSVLVMRELSGLSIEEIAAASSSTPGAVKQTLFEAREALRENERGRSMECEQVRRLIYEDDRRALRGRRIGSHLRACAGCRELAETIATRRKDLLALAPPLPAAAAVALLSHLLGAGAHIPAGAASGASSAGGAGSSGSGATSGAGAASAGASGAGPGAGSAASGASGATQAATAASGTATTTGGAGAASAAGGAASSVATHAGSAILAKVLATAAMLAAGAAGVAGVTSSGAHHSQAAHHAAASHASHGAATHRAAPHADVNPGQPGLDGLKRSRIGRDAAKRALGSARHRSAAALHATGHSLGQAHGGEAQAHANEPQHGHARGRSAAQGARGQSAGTPDRKGAGKPGGAGARRHVGRGESRGHQQHSKRAAAPSKAIGKGRRPEEHRSSSSSRTGERASHETQTAGKLTSTREANEGQSGGKGYDQQHAVTGSTPVAVEDEAVTVEAPVGEHSKGKR